MRHKTKILH